MSKVDSQKLLEKLNEWSNSSFGHDSEFKLLEILTPLLETEGYTVMPVDSAQSHDMGIDFLATRPTDLNPELPNNIGIEYKHTVQPIGASAVQRLLGVSVINSLDRLILLSRSGFTKQAWDITKHSFPTAIELLDLDSLKGWILRLERSSDDYSSVVQAIKELSKQFARIIARNPEELMQMEWRDMERMLAAVFDDLGFRVELTPSSKDGGKDLILEFSVLGEKRSYLVEVKHWRSQQKVGKGYISDFVNVVANEKRQGGLYLATYGYCHDAFEALTEIQKNSFYAGNEQKIVSLCTTFVKAETGLWSAPTLPTDLIIENTINL